MTMGGAEKVALSLSSGLAQRGYDVDLVVVNGGGELFGEVPDHVQIVNLSAGRVLNSIHPLSRYLNSENPDVLLSMMTEPNIAAVLATIMSRTKTRLVLTEHSTLSKSSKSVKNRAVMLLAKYLYPRADHVVTVSEGVRNDLLSVTNLLKSDISIIYNPVDIEDIKRKAEKPLNHAWFHEEDKEVILAGGRHSQEKRFDILLEAFRRIESEQRRLVLFGEGPQTDALKADSAQLGICDDVCFTGMVMNPYKYMAHADLFVLSSEYEGFGLVLIEALACGCPIVSTDCESGPAEILDKGTFGRLVAVNDVQALSEGIDDALSDSINTKRLVDRADEFNVAAALNKYEKVLSDCC